MSRDLVSVSEAWSGMLEREWDMTSHLVWRYYLVLAGTDRMPMVALQRELYEEGYFHDGLRKTRGKPTLGMTMSRVERLGLLEWHERIHWMAAKAEVHGAFLDAYDADLPEQLHFILSRQAL